jgi:ribose transport system substrate-binding protein
MNTVRPTLLALAAATALALTSCTSATSAAEQETTVTATGAAAECQTTAQAAVDAAREPLDLIAPTSPLDTQAVAGKSVWFVTLSMNQFSIDMFAGVSEAAEAAGMTAVSFDGQGTLSRASEGLEQAVAQGAAGIVLVALDPSLVSAPLQAAEAAGIPVLDFMSNTQGVPADHTFASLTSDFAADGKLAADWSMARTGCASDMVLVHASVLKIWTEEVDAAKEELEALCDDCESTIIDVDLPNISTSLPNQLTTKLQSDPDVTDVFVAWDSAVPFIQPVVASSGADPAPSVMARDGISTSLEMIAAGTQDFTLATPPPGWIGWLSFDMTARAITGAEIPDYTIPTRIIDETNIGDGTDADVSPNYTDYQSAFTAAWEG